MLPSSGESWEITWTLDCIAAKKEGWNLQLRGRAQSGREGQGGFMLRLCLSLNLALFLCCVSAGLHEILESCCEAFLME